jgi:Uma2 family endonuclease
MPEKSRVEVIDGALIVNPSPLPLHQRIARRLAAALEHQLPTDWQLETEIDILLQADPLDYVAPDLVVFTATTSLTTRPIPAEDVLLVVEVVSRGSRRQDRATKHLAYAEAGIRHYWRVESAAAGNAATEIHVFGLRKDADSYDGGTVHRTRLTLSDPFGVDIDLDALLR